MSRTTEVRQYLVNWGSGSKWRSDWLPYISAHPSCAELTKLFYLRYLYGWRWFLVHRWSCDIFGLDLPPWRHVTNEKCQQRVRAGNRRWLEIEMECRPCSLQAMMTCCDSCQQFAEKFSARLELSRTSSSTVTQTAYKPFLSRKALLRNVDWNLNTPTFHSV